MPIEIEQVEGGRSSCCTRKSGEAPLVRRNKWREEYYSRLIEPVPEIFWLTLGEPV